MKGLCSACWQKATSLIALGDIFVNIMDVCSSPQRRNAGSASESGSMYKLQTQCLCATKFIFPVHLSLSHTRLWRCSSRIKEFTVEQPLWNIYIYICECILLSHVLHLQQSCLNKAADSTDIMSYHNQYYTSLYCPFEPKDTQHKLRVTLLSHLMEY